MLREYLKSGGGWLAGVLLWTTVMSAFEGFSDGVLAEEDVLPALVVRARQDVKWGLYDPKLNMPRGKRDFASELLETLQASGGNPSKRDIGEAFAASYEEAYKPLDLYQDFAGVPEFTLDESSFSDFNMWVGGE